jgi:pSer/pThr/pTyr-binding forkhead associated (FHA) protein
MAASLIPMEGGSPIALDKPIMLIGRNQDCDISLQTSSKISRRHCCIVQCGDRYLLRDLGSMNGVRVNAQRVVEMELNAGDEVSVADVSFTFRVDDGRVKNRGRMLAENSPNPAGPSAGPTGQPFSTPNGDHREGDHREPEEEHHSHTYSDDQILENQLLGDEVRLKDDSESEAGFVRV